MSVYLPIAEIAIDLRILICLGLVVGFLSGMFGIGGGFIVTPFLIFLGVPPAVAVGTGASQVVASSVSGALGALAARQRRSHAGLLLLAGGIVGATIGVEHPADAEGRPASSISSSLTYVVMLGTIGALMLIESVRTMAQARRRRRRVSSRRGGQHTWVQRPAAQDALSASRSCTSAPFRRS